ncbi:cytosolic protein [Bacillus songklensis]|uniref:Cytosolic protein n=1 Tax=Bacillus songklensis TaxID=1069116 RepID=A0ABV8AYY4_9BACI
MGLLQSLKQAFSNHCETADHHDNDQLRTHYYKATTANAFTAIKKLVEELDGFELLSASEEHGEISVNIKKGKKAFMVISVVSLRPFETAVDFSVTTETVFIPFDFGYSKELVKKMYELLDQKLVLMKTGQSLTKQSRFQ